MRHQSSAAGSPLPHGCFINTVLPPSACLQLLLPRFGQIGVGHHVKTMVPVWVLHAPTPTSGAISQTSLMSLLPMYIIHRSRYLQAAEPISSSDTAGPTGICSSSSDHGIHCFGCEVFLAPWPKSLSSLTTSWRVQWIAVNSFLWILGLGLDSWLGSICRCPGCMSLIMLSCVYLALTVPKWGGKRSPPCVLVLDTLNWPFLCATPPPTFFRLEDWGWKQAFLFSSSTLQLRRFAAVCSSKAILRFEALSSGSILALHH